MTQDREDAMAARFECREAMERPCLLQWISDQFKGAYDHAGALLRFDELQSAKR
jgi:hypothetical protein